MQPDPIFKGIMSVYIQVSDLKLWDCLTNFFYFMVEAPTGIIFVKIETFPK